MKKALITGVTGQDGSYLAEFYWIKDMTCMGRYDALPWISGSGSHIWKDIPGFICIMRIWETL